MAKRSSPSGLRVPNSCRLTDTISSTRTHSSFPQICSGVTRVTENSRDHGPLSPKDLWRPI